MYPIKKDEIAKASGTLAEAFFSYPFFAPAIREEKRLKALTLMFEVDVRYAMKKGGVYALDQELNEVSTWHYDMGKLWDTLTFMTCIRPRILSLLPLIGLEGMHAFDETAREVERHIAGLDLPEKTAYLSCLGIKPEYRGQHRMRMLLNPMLQALEENGFSVCLYTNDPENIARYESFGFRTVDTIKHREIPISSYFMLKSAL